MCLIRSDSPRSGYRADRRILLSGVRGVEYVASVVTGPANVHGFRRRRRPGAVVANVGLIDVDGGADLREPLRAEQILKCERESHVGHHAAPEAQGMPSCHGVDATGEHRKLIPCLVSRYAVGDVSGIDNGQSEQVVVHLDLFGQQMGSVGANIARDVGNVDDVNSRGEEDDVRVDDGRGKGEIAIVDVWATVWPSNFDMHDFNVPPKELSVEMEPCLG